MTPSNHIVQHTVNITQLVKRIGKWYFCNNKAPNLLYYLFLKSIMLQAHHNCCVPLYTLKINKDFIIQSIPFVFLKNYTVQICKPNFSWKTTARRLVFNGL